MFCLNSKIMAGCLGALASGWVTGVSAQTADLVISNGNILTMDTVRNRASSVAIRDNMIVYVGDEAGLSDLVGPDTKVIDAGGQIVLPGLHDVHIHPLYNVTPQFGGEKYECDFEGKSVDLDETVAKLRACLAVADLNEDGWLIGKAFNPPSLLSTTETYPTVRAALDAISGTVPIRLDGSDGHAFGFNSAAYQRARHPKDDRPVAVTGASLANEYKPYGEYFNVDSNGEPDGTAKDFAQVIIAAPEAQVENFKPVLGELRALMASNGVTSAQDALVTDTLADVYSYMEANNLLDFRVRLNTHIDSNFYGGRDRPVDIDAALSAAGDMRDRFSNALYIKADGVKLFVDGVVEYPTQTAAMQHPYLEPIIDDASKVLGYVNLDGDICNDVRANLSRYEDGEVARSFEDQHGFAAMRCKKRYGLLEFTPAELNRAVAAFDREGFTVHMHALGDRAVHVALNAIEAARAENGTRGLAHNLAHIQFVAPDDVARIGEMGVVVTPTYSWAVPFWEYDTTVIPFINEVKSVLDLEAIYHPDGLWHERVYPFRSIRDAGGILAAGSDAPVDQPTPQPFANIAAGLIRADLLPVNPTSQEDNEPTQVVAVNADEVLALDDLLAAYTINGAIAMGQENETGSIEVGKKADLIMIDQDIEALAQEVATIWDIADTKVLLTVFDGRIVWDQRPAD